MAHNEEEIDLDDEGDVGAGQSGEGSNAAGASTSDGGKNFEGDPMKNATPREKKLYELKMKLSRSKNQNYRAVKEEKKRLADPNWDKKRAYEADQELDGDMKGDAEVKEEVAGGKKWNPKAYLNETAEAADAKKGKKKGNKAFGWDIFNQDAQYRAYKKRTKKLKTEEEYEDMKRQQKDVYKDKDNLMYGQDAVTDQAKVNRMVNELEETAERRKNFSRRRQFYEDADVDYINERNAHFNKKASRAFDSYTTEIRQNLERGTAL